MTQRKKEPGLDYMIDLGFYPAKTGSAVVQQLMKATDKSTAQKIIKLIDRRAVGIKDNEMFYSIKNEDYNASLALTSAFDADILRKACNWIFEHSQYFGNTILEVGCDCGVMTCFIAKTFPQSRIVAIDRCAAGVENAKKLAATQCVTNVEFRVCDFSSITETFDTVFSMRTVHENGTVNEDVMLDLSEQAAVFQNCLVPYASMLARVLPENGTLISIERIGRNAKLLGWMAALDEFDFGFDLSCYEELLCKEVGKDSAFQAFICFKGIKNEISARNLFDYACSAYLDYSLASYEDWDAKIVFENRRKKLIEGYEIDYPKQYVRAKLSVWTHRYDETCIMLYQNNNGVVKLSFHDISLLDEVCGICKQAVKDARSHGGIIVQLNSDKVFAED